jgi:hypothetical protein
MTRPRARDKKFSNCLMGAGVLARALNIGIARAHALVSTARKKTQRCLLADHDPAKTAESERTKKFFDSKFRIWVRIWVGLNYRVGLAGFEPTTSRTPSVRATKLRYSPTILRFGKNQINLEVLKGSMPISSPSTI